MWIDLGKILSYNSLIYVIIAERGVGKSYGCKKYIVNHFKKTGKQSVYLRRYKSELQEALMKKSEPIFFNQIKSEFPNDTLTNNTELLFCNKEICGYAVPLSISNILKSSTFEKVDTIIFDEFIIDNGCYHYLKNEVVALLELIESVARLRDIKVIMLGNAISITNPYFTELNLSLPYNSEFKVCKKDKDGKPLILVYYGKNMKYREEKKKTRFGQLIADTKYGQYAIDNVMLRDSKAFIKKRDKRAKFFFILNINNNYIGVWNNWNDNEIYLSKDYDPSCPIIFSLSASDHDEKTLLIRCRTSPFFKSIIDHYRNGKLFFDNQQIKNQVMEILNRYLTY